MSNDAKHSVEDRTKHYAHLAHEAHLAAERLEGLSHKFHLAGKYASNLEAARKILRAHSQMANDLRRMNRAMIALANQAKQGGKVGPAAAARFSAAKDSYAAAQSAFKSEKAAASAANAVFREFHSIQGAAQSASSNARLLKFGETVAKFESALQGSTVGRGLLSTGKIVSSKAFVKGLVVVGAALEGFRSYVDTPTKTTGGKVANTALGAAGGALVMANPLVAVGDFVLPEGFKLSEIFHGSAAVFSSIGEAAITSDTRALDAFHKRSMNGSYGKVLQAASEAGEYWDKKGLSGGMKEFVDSLKWWVSQF